MGGLYEVYKVFEVDALDVPNRVDAVGQAGWGGLDGLDGCCSTGYELHEVNRSIHECFPKYSPLITQPSEGRRLIRRRLLYLLKMKNKELFTRGNLGTDWYEEAVSHNRNEFIIN